ncbi:MAG: hypothetical protein UU48_C0023G0006 [Candidatus Uhrbacteria bacterium GW2011_GWF2_41_16]|uniref:Uncharacterized protein n=1 Tax=Candidatus Uhrbacteria bacterium GW2011_GWF2_41_16 TaxID=1618997 RepID=A0A0G0XJ59_9BACT|nr:MAG: hypothetical protein UU48_C0023G0006 [Candidatus Uhrbacteria bacterium GW2011_GWF2_41_16]
MKKLLQVLIPILCVPFLCGVTFGSKPKEFHVLSVTEMGDVAIDAGRNVTKPNSQLQGFFRANGST